MTALQRARGTVTRSMVVLDVYEKNSDEDREWLRAPGQVVAFYDMVRAMAAEAHRKIEEYGRGDRDLSRSEAAELKRLYSAISHRIPEVRPIAAAQKRFDGEHLLWSAIRSHRDAHVDANIEPTEHDLALWALLEPK